MARYNMARYVAEPWCFQFENVPVKKQQCRQRLLMGGSGNFPLSGKPRQKAAYFGNPHFARMTFAMKLDKTPDPLDIRLLRAYAVVLVPSDIAGTFKQAERLRWRSAVFGRVKMTVHKHSISMRNQKSRGFLGAVFSGIGGAVPGWTARLTSTLR